jgi:hypothetical protein
MKASYIAAIVVVIVAIAGLGIYLTLYPPEEPEVVLQFAVDGQDRDGFSMQDLENMATSINTDGSTVQGVRLADLLEGRGIDPSDVLTIRPTGIDGYSRDSEGQYVDEGYIWLVPEEDQIDEGTLKIVFPSQEEKFSIHHLAKLEILTES